MYAGFLECGFGLIRVTADENYVTSIKFVEKMSFDLGGNRVTDNAVNQLMDYFLGIRKTFDVKMKLEGTDFQKSVWNVLLDIPYGKTTTYGEIAQKLGNPKAVRAVGSAVGKNPIAIVVPCHRVIGKDGSITGYAYGTDKKERLLALEKEHFK